MSDTQLLCTRHHAPFQYLLYEKIYRDRAGYAVAICRDEKVLAYAEDITDRKDAAERFLALISEGGLEPCHLYDLLEDLLPLR